MTNINLQLLPSLSLRLDREAERVGLSSDALAVKLLDERLSTTEDNRDTIALLQSWIDEKEIDTENDDYDLLKALDEARTSNRKLFPEELKGISW